MGSQICLTDFSAPLLADTSTVINVIATGFASSIAQALPCRLTVVDTVLAELEMGRARGRNDAQRFNDLAAEGLVEIVSLGDSAMRHFEDLVIGPASLTLDDGEAATIAYAVDKRGAAFIDERKATRICAVRYPTLRIACTVDILLHPDVQRRLGRDGLGEAIFGALQKGRMRVFPQHVERVIGFIGRRTRYCTLSEFA